MTERNHQTVRLAAGRHTAPEQGACVVELASILAGEPFSDHPQSVSPVLAAFLRGYNDLAGDARQDLLRCAADAVGTRLDDDAERERVDLCLAALDDIGDLTGLPRLQRWLWLPSASRLRRLVAADPIGPMALERFAYGLALLLTRKGAAGHERAMRLVDDLVAVGRTPEAIAPTTADPALALR